MKTERTTAVLEGVAGTWDETVVSLEAGEGVVTDTGGTTVGTCVSILSVGTDTLTVLVRHEAVTVGDGTQRAGHSATKVARGSFLNGRGSGEGHKG